MDLYSILMYLVLAVILKLIYDYFWKKTDISNKTVVITGSGQGIGRELCKQFVQANCNIACVDINQTQNEITVKLAKSLNATVVVKSYTCDVSNYQHVQELSQQIRRDFGSIDILVNNAGIVGTGTITDFTEEQIKKTLQVNIMAHFWTTKSFLPQMLEKNSGYVVAISSVLGVLPSPFVIPYCTSKFAVHGFMEALKLELVTLKSKVKCLTVFPSIVNTQMMNFMTGNSVLLEMTEPQSLAQSIVDAVRREKTVLYVPKYIKLGIIVKAILPDFLFEKCISILDFNNLIDRNMKS